MPRTYGLPNGKRTINVQRYVREWRKLARPICKLTGAHLHAFDPSVQISFHPDGRRFGRVMDLSVEFLQKFNEGLRETAKKLANLNGSWLDQYWGCRVCGGEIPYGHTENCDIYKMEKRIRELESQVKGK